jgi:hypothetical protein
MPATYEPIATTTLGTATNIITFSSIPSTYTDIRLVFVTNNTRTGGGAYSLIINGDSGANYSQTTLDGNGSSSSSTRLASVNQVDGWNDQFGSNNTNMRLLATYDFLSYAGSTNKTCLVTGSYDYNGSGKVLRYVNLWRNTAAITSLTLNAIFASTNFAVGTTATLYGIKNA